MPRRQPADDAANAIDPCDRLVADRFQRRTARRHPAAMHDDKLIGKFRRKVVPGDVLELKIETTRGKPGGKVWRFKGQATVEGEMAAEAEFTAMMDLEGATGGAA